MLSLARWTGATAAKVAWIAVGLRVGISVLESNDGRTLQYVSWYKVEREKCKELPEDQRQAKNTENWNHAVEKFAEHGGYHLFLLAVKGPMDMALLHYYVPKWAVMLFSLLKYIKTSTTPMIEVIKEKVTKLRQTEDIPGTMIRWLQVAQDFLENNAEARLNQEFYDRLTAVCEYAVYVITAAVVNGREILVTAVRGLANLTENQILTYTLQFLGALVYLGRTVSDIFKSLLPVPTAMLLNVQ